MNQDSKMYRSAKEFFHFIKNLFQVPGTSLAAVITGLSPDHAAVECEVVELQANDTLKAELITGVSHFWNMVPDTECPALKTCVQKVSTYTCESTFSTMNSVKRKHRNRLTNAHLDSITRIAMKKYKIA